uniref:Bridging integrator 3 n=1 Tax=Gallus gallus TaxID=9031 RepID=A0A8V0ZCC8_CHICK
MSWIPFKIGQPKKQIVPKTVERDFEREYGKLQQLEEQTKKLQKDMKKSTDADLAMSKAAVKISSDLLSNPLCEQDAAFLGVVTAFDTAMRRMDSFNQEKVNQIQKTVIEPLKKFGSVFPSLNMAVKRREQTLQEYRRLQAKVEKYEEKERSGPGLAKLHQRSTVRPTPVLQKEEKGLSGAIQRHTAPYSAILCHTAPYSAILCHTAPYSAIQRHTVPYSAIQRHTVPCNAMQCHTAPYCAILCHVMPCSAILCHAVPCNAI